LLREILPLFLKPVPVALLLLAVGVLRRRWWPVFTAACVLWFSSTPLFSGILMGLVEQGRVQPDLQQVAAGDCILVLSGGGYRLLPGSETQVEFETHNRLLGGIALLTNGAAPRLLFTNGLTTAAAGGLGEGHLLQRLATSLGVPPQSIIVVGNASDTEEEARAVREHFAANPIMDADTGQPRSPRIILVTSAFHMTRAESLFRAAGLDVTPFSVDFRGPTRITLRSFIPSGNALAKTDLALHEIYGRVYYWLRGLVVGSAI